MLGKIFGAFAGERAARHFNGIDGPMGAALGVGAASVIRRFGPWGMIAVAVGGYAFKRYQDKKLHDKTTPGTPARATNPAKDSPVK
jgi:hypothetical protein